MFKFFWKVKNMWQLFKNMKKSLIFDELKFQKSANNSEKEIEQFIMLFNDYIIIKYCYIL